MPLTQDDQILAHLQAGQRITPLEALHLYGCFRLAARIHELRQSYPEIRSGKRKVGAKQVAEYWMD